MKKKNWGTVVIGGGQAGLAAGYYLKKIHEDFIILDEGARTGDRWRQRWDSLALFTPAEHDSLPWFPFPSPRGSFPTKDDMAEYLEEYARKFSLPIQFNTGVTELSESGSGYRIITSKGELFARQVIVATGTNPVPYIPEFAKDLDPKITQIHSSEYKNPGSLPASETLVVGAGTSGVEIALELSQSRPVMVSGRPTPHIPEFFLKHAGKLYWRFIHHVITLNTPIGRKVRKKIVKGGAPLISVSPEDLKKAGVALLPRISGVLNGLPQQADNRVITVHSIVWATGFKPDFSWIRMEITDQSGWPKTKRGISEGHKGLYFVGMLFQFGLTSGLVGGVGRDAAYVVGHLQKNR
jgi:putative flavoprotein involved in K+ transport